MKQLVNLTGDFAKRDHLRQLKNEPPPIKWMEEPLDFRMLPDQLIARFHKVQRRNAGKTRASERTKDSLLRILGRVIARNGVQTLKQKSPNLSDRKLARFEKELAALEYNRLLFMGRDKHERRRLFAVLHPWEDVAIGRLVAEYGLHAESAYSRAANRTGGIIRTGLIKATARSPGFAKMMRQKVALPEIGFPWVNIRQLGKRRELYDAPAWKGQSREHERLPYLLDWEHFKMRHPNQRRILKAERKLQRTRK
ncbi:hypothetical protein KJ765_02145 [Candidatus Micrarchaeota archaeon]|nr:hypothetical protein [Candidatus Micrarchaeota archaeon]